VESRGLAWWISQVRPRSAGLLEHVSRTCRPKPSKYADTPFHPTVRWHHDVRQKLLPRPRFSSLALHFVLPTISPCPLTPRANRSTVSVFPGRAPCMDDGGRFLKLPTQTHPELPRETPTIFLPWTSANTPRTQSADHIESVSHPMRRHSAYRATST
jgi:hypothetical protein